jgi:hypothetical protein
MCLLISHRGSSFVLVYYIERVFIPVNREARLFRVTPHHFNSDFILRDRKPMVEICSYKLIAKIVYKRVYFISDIYTQEKKLTDPLQTIK